MAKLAILETIEQRREVEVPDDIMKNLETLWAEKRSLKAEMELDTGREVSIAQKLDVVNNEERETGWVDIVEKQLTPGFVSWRPVLA